eukprot:scaffold103096_cov50-Phaeocystis_antarctica.AAC.4
MMHVENSNQQASSGEGLVSILHVRRVLMACVGGGWSTRRSAGSRAARAGRARRLLGYAPLPAPRLRRIPRRRPDRVGADLPHAAQRGAWGRAGKGIRKEYVPLLLTMA